LEKTEWAIRNGQPRDTGNIGHNTHDEDKQQQNITQNIKHLTIKAIVLSVLLRFTVSDYPFGILDLRFLITPLVSYIYGFWLLPFGILYLRFQITPLVSYIYGFWLPPFGILDLRFLITPLWCLRFTVSDYPPLVSYIYGFWLPSFVSYIYGFWLSLWYLRFTISDYPFGILDLRFLNTLLWYLRFTVSDYPPLVS
jgi:hypothetical protein